MTLPETLFEASFNQTLQAMVILNEQGMPALWNDAFYDLLLELSGLSPDKLSLPLFDWLQERDGFQYSYYLTEVLLGRMGAATIETQLTTSRGTRIWLRSSLALLTTPSRQRGSLQPDRWLHCVLQNISAQKRHEHELVSAKESAEKATLTKSQFLANMSHEIRTPIQTILGMTELLHETGLDKEQSDYIDTVRFSADVLLGLINDILDFSKIEAGKIELEATDFDLPDILRQSVALLILDAHKKQLEVLVDIDDRLPRLIRGDPGKLRQVMVNLFKNAIKFTGSGEIVITASLRQEGRKPELLVRVSDSGSGVPAELVEKLFTPFTQANAGSTTQGGTGLGLAISQYLIKIMGGRIFYEPNQKRGAVFGFCLPLVHAEFSLPPRSWSIPQTTRVLIVDDHPLAQDYAKRQIARLGLEADTVGDGPAAIERLHAAAAAGQPYTLCLIDQEMPGMDGWRLAAEITADRQINTAKLILVAPEGAVDPEAKMKHLNWFNAYLNKPLHPIILFDTIESVLNDVTELAGVEDGEPEVGRPEARDDGPGLSLSVLLTEDHLVNQELFTLLLKKLGCTVDVAQDGQEAVNKAATNHYDMILMDIFMPVMDGYQATRRLREQGFHKPIIAVTASALKGERDKCIEHGMNDILIKPFKRKDLEAMISFWANKTEGQRHSLPLVPAEDANTSWDRGVFDLEELVDTFLGNRQTVLSLLQRFISKTRGQLADLAQAVELRDYTQVREISHSIKGAAWNLTALPLGNAAKLLEQAAAVQDGERVQALLPELVENFSEFTLCAANSIDPNAGPTDEPRLDFGKG